MYIKIFIITSVLLYGMGITHAAEINAADHDSIQLAIDAAIANDDTSNTIIIDRGTYDENITINNGTNRITLQGNETARTIIRSQKNDTSPTITIADDADVILQNLTFIDARTAIQIGNNVTATIRNNVFDGDSAATAIEFSLNETNTSIDVSIENNTFYKNKIVIDGSLINVSVKNNIFSENDSIITDSDVNNAILFTHNCFHKNEARGENATSTEDPNFVDTGRQDFHLMEQSECIDKGIDDTDEEIDAGAYGGKEQDDIPLQVESVEIEKDAIEGSFKISWAANKAYRIAGYRVYYDDKEGAFDGSFAKDAEQSTISSPLNVETNTELTLFSIQRNEAILTAPTIKLAPNNETVTITWDKIEGATAYTVHHGVDSTDENNTQTTDTSKTITSLENNKQYKFAVSAERQSRLFVAVMAYHQSEDGSIGTENVLSESELASISVGKPVISAKSNEEIVFAEAVVPFPAGLPDNENCFIATAAFGYYSAPEVKILRNFRDKFLLTNDLGKTFVNWYYQNSPPVAATIRDNATLKGAVRVLLYPLIKSATLFTQFSWLLALQSLLVLSTGLLLGYIVFRQAANAYRVFSRSLKVGFITGLVLFSSNVWSEERVPNWSFELKTGVFQPKTENWEIYYNNKRTEQTGLALAYKIFRPIEIGVDVSYLRDHGTGQLPLNNQVGGSVVYESMPVSAYLTLRMIFSERQWIVPYVSAGVVRAYYKQTIKGQDNISGSVNGQTYQIGLQFLLDAIDRLGAGSAAREYGIDNTYLYIAGQTTKLEIDDLDLGGDSLFAGFLFEF